jgi:hypothetical protein
MLGDDETKISVLFANRNEKSIPLKNKLDAWAADPSKRFEAFHLLSQVRWTIGLPKPSNSFSSL